MIDGLILFIRMIAWFLTVAVIVQVVISYFLSPYHTFRSFVDRIVAPFLQPIQRIIPPAGGIDFSPMVLIILIQVLETVLTKLLLNLG